MGAKLKSKSGRTILRNLNTRMARLREKIAGVEVVAGFVRGKSSAESIFKAYANEYGTSETNIVSSDLWKHIISRPFMHQSIPEIRESVSAVFADATTKNIADKMETAGEVMEIAIENSLSSGNFETNTKYTLARKNGTQPLIDTGAMRSDITSEVRRGE